MLLWAIVVLLVLIVILQLISMNGRRSPVPMTAELVDIRGSVGRLQALFESLASGGKTDFSLLRTEVAGQNQALKLELDQALRRIGDGMQQKLDSYNADGNQKIDMLRRAVMDSGAQLQTQVTTVLDQVRKTMDERLEQMRLTVDEKLQNTLDTRLNESFRTVHQQLIDVHQGLGEMKSLAAGVDGLKRVLTNVKARGTWGEVQLGNLLQEILRPEQYEKNAAVTGTNERVDFAIRLPGTEAGQPLWLPVDAKFPVEDYHRILDAAERADATALDRASRELETTVRESARSIRAKYIDEKHTTGFAILFLATEGLYAETLRRPGLAESLQREFSVLLSGPSTFAALLTSLRVGFRTLTIEQKAGEIERRLREVQLAFERYGQLLGKVKRKLQEASSTVERAEKGNTKLQKALREVEADETQAVNAASATA